MTAPAQGPTVSNVHVTGDASQNAVGNVVGRDLLQTMVTYVRGRPALYLGPTEIRDRLSSYVPVHNHDLIVKALDTHHAIALTGAPGCGRETTAIAAIQELHSSIPIRRFSAGEEDVEEIGPKGLCGYLARAADETLPRLMNCVDAVRAAPGYLVVIADETERSGLASFLPTITVEPPDALRVYRHRLAIHGLASTQWPHWQEVPVLLQQALPGDARRLADLIQAIGQRPGDVAARQVEVAHAYREWTDELHDWFGKHREPNDRALLVAAATLEPAEEANVYSAALSLARRLEVTVSGAGLAWCPVKNLGRLLSADRDNGRIVFRRHGFAQSTLRHVVTEYPLARSDLLTWLAALPMDEAIAANTNTQTSLVESFAELAAEYGTAEHVTEAARTWAHAELPNLAYIALSATCLHPRVGGKVRRALYDWSRTPRLQQTLKLTIARVCEPLGQVHLSIALTRLKHLATHGNTQVVDEVIAAMLGLADTDRGREVLRAALTWAADADTERLSVTARERRIRAGTMLFLKLAKRPSASGLPEVLDGDGAVDPQDCAGAWRAALYARAAASGEPNAEFEEIVHRWLDAALHRPRLRERIVWVFVNATASPAVPYAPHDPRQAVAGPIAVKIMVGMARRWAELDPSDPDRQEIKKDIVAPLTNPWWLRLFKILYARLRTLITTARQPM